MADNSGTLWQLYNAVAAVWRSSGADPLQCLETVFEMLALQKQCLWRRKDVNFGSVELTLSIWQNYRERLCSDLNMPKDFVEEAHLSKFVSREPGLLELTRRAVVSTYPTPFELKSGEVVSVLHFLSGSHESGPRRSSPDYFTGTEYLSLFVSKLLGKPTQEPLYCPFNDTAWMCLTFAGAGWRVACEVTSTQIARILLLVAYLVDLKVEVHVADPIYSPSWLGNGALQRFQRSAAITTFGLRFRDNHSADRYDRFPARFHYGETAQVAHLIAQTAAQALAIVPEGFLVRSSGGERDYKEQLIRRGILSGVIKLPRYAFAPYANIQTSLLIFEMKSPCRGVLFVDASNEFDRKSVSLNTERCLRRAVEDVCSIVSSRISTHISNISSYEEIAAQNFNISADRYVLSEDEQRITAILYNTAVAFLGDVAEVTRPQAVPPCVSGHVHTFREVSLQDVQSDGSIHQPAKLVKVDDRALAKVIRQKLEPRDVLLSIRGRIGTVGIVPELDRSDSSTGWLASQAFAIIRLRDNSRISYLALFRYLASPLGQKLVQSLASGATVPMVSMGDVKKLRIIIPSHEEQRLIEQQYEKIRRLRAQINDLERLSEELNASSWPMSAVSRGET